MKIFVGITGASGQIYGGTLLRALSELDHNVTACFSNAAVEVICAEEAGFAEFAGQPGKQVIAEFLNRHGIAAGNIKIAPPEDMTNMYASGSSLADAAIVCPCSMSSLASMAAGITRNLIHRAADVMLKESRPLIIVPRETPLSVIHLENMLRLKRAGAMIVPAMPGFYHNPATIDDLSRFVVGKVLDVLNIPHDIFTRWKG